MRCTKSRPSRACALKFYLNDDSIKLTKIIDNKYNLIINAQSEHTSVNYLVITEARRNVIRNRIAYPERFDKLDDNYRTKIITGHSDAIEIKYEIKSSRKSHIYYLYKLPKKTTTNNIKSDEIIDSALDKLLNDPNYIDQYLDRIKVVFKDLITDSFNRGYEAGYDEGLIIEYSK